MEAESWSQTKGSGQSSGAHRFSQHGRELGVVPVAPSSLGTRVAAPGLCGPVEGPGLALQFNSGDTRRSNHTFPTE